MIKKINFTIYNFVKNLVYFTFSKIIILSLLLAKIQKYKLIYTSSYGFGDNVIFNIFARKKIEKNKIFCYSKTQYEISNFFYDKKNIFKSIILLPKILNETHIAYNYLENSNFFKPIFIKRMASDGKYLPISFLYHGNIKIKKFIISKLKKKEISKDLERVLKKKTITLFIKNFSLNRNNHINFQVRQTRDLKKIYKLINYILKKKINIIILGNNKDHFIKILEKKMVVKNKKNLYLFKNLSKKYSIQDQIYLALKSIGCVGSGSGANSLFGILKNKQLYIDWITQNHDKYWKKRITFMYKRIYNKKTEKTYRMSWYKKYDPSYETIIENNFEEIKKKFNKIFI